jgi:hypothetical protein
MKIRQTARLALIVASVLICSDLLTAQDEPIGDVARQTRAEKAQAAHAKKTVTDEDFGPDLAPVSETDDPAQVVNKARRAWMTDMPRTCREFSSSSRSNSTSEGTREIAAPDRIRMVGDQRGGSQPGHSELIIVGSEIFSRFGSGPWRKDSSAELVAAMPRWRPEALADEFAAGELKLVRRDAVAGVPALVYETKSRHGGGPAGDATTDYWVGTKDNLLRKLETVTEGADPSGRAAEFRYTVTCSYGPVPEIKPPI